MGLFDKKVCDICGEKIGLLGNRKLDDGNLCKDCAKKLSPWFEERRHSTVEDIKKQLAYREQNKEAVRNFRVTRDLKADNNYHVFIDDNHQKFGCRDQSGYSGSFSGYKLSHGCGTGSYRRTVSGSEWRDERLCASKIQIFLQI